MSYEDEEQIERLKRWWSENWKAIVGGLVIGLVVIFGWEAWKSSGTRTSTEASLRFDQLVAEVDRGQADSAAALRDELVNDFRRTPYAAMATMRMARLYVEAGDLDRAAAELDWAHDNARDDGVKKLARARLAQVRWAKGDADGALALLDRGSPGAMVGLYEELRGDILLSEGRRAEARQAYERALAELEPGSGHRELLERKLQDLTDVVAS